MSKLSFDLLKERAESIVSAELLNSISGGTENACHDDEPTKAREYIEQHGGQQTTD